MLVQEPVQAAIWHCLNHYAYPDAIFLAERLRAEVESDETLFLLATCYYRSGKPGQAYSILKGKGLSSPQCKYLMARCCVDLQKLSEAESVLCGGEVTRARCLDEISAEFGDSAGFALMLLAHLCCQSERKQRGLEAYRRALRINPLLWQAYEALCRRGERPDPARVFTIPTAAEGLSAMIGSNPVLNYVNTCCETIDMDFSSSTPVHMINILSSNSAPSGIRPFTPEESIYSRPSKPTRYRNIFTPMGSPLTPSFGVLPLDSSSPLVTEGGFVSTSPLVTLSAATLTEVNDLKMLAKRQQALNLHKDTPPLHHQSKPVFSQSGNTSHSVHNSNSLLASPQSIVIPPSVVSQPLPLHSHIAQNTVRRSSRLFSNSYLVKAFDQENTKSPNRTKFATPKSPSRKTKSRLAKSQQLNNKAVYNDLNERNRMGSERGGDGESSSHKAALHGRTQHAIAMQKQSIEGLMLLLRDLGAAYLHLSRFECQKAIERLKSLPPQHYNTGWVLSILGKAYFELANYQQAIRYFGKARSRDAHRTQLMELYSTALWHLQRESALSALAQDLITQDRQCPAAWCAAGNCFSLQKEHDAAVKFFQRAVQVDPSFAYAYTLLGHEYVATEELDKAMNCFRNAVKIDSRHYNAWYGIGSIYSKQERFMLAEKHYKMALSINHCSPVIMCHIGVVQNALQKTDQALATLSAAIALDPANPLCKFHRASIYFAASRHAEALKELEELKTIVPKESLVYYLTGKVHKKLGNSHLALMHFSWATDLDPKGANSQIKEATDPNLSHAQLSDISEEFPMVGSGGISASSTAVLDPPHQQMQDSDESL